ncbi:MAG: hypothetical protein K9G34_11595 [Melioribacteraceae bacterium]|nr:hypothetical protein [Melioribacteraceae bacterium]
MFAQSANDSLKFAEETYSQNVYSSSYNKKLNVNSLKLFLNYGFQSDDYFLGVNEEFNSTVLKSSTKNIRDEQRLSIIGETGITNYLRTGIYVDNYIYSDDRSIAINKAFDSKADIYLKIIPMEGLKLTPFLGYISNEQSGEINNGLNYGAELSTKRIKLSDQFFTANGFFRNEDISPRKNFDRFLKLDLESRLENDFQNLISVQYSSQKKDFYFTADSILSEKFNVNNNIQSRNETIYSIRDNLNFTAFRNRLFLNLRGRLDWREIERNTRYKDFNRPSASLLDTRISELKIQLNSDLQYRSDWFNSDLRFFIEEEDEKHEPVRIEELDNIFFEERLEDEKRKNNISNLATISSNSSFRIGDNDLLNISLLHRKLIYDTPSSDNFDDRDELLSIFSLKYLKKINALFDFFVQLEGNVNHVVYLFSERSGNNNIRRVLKLSAGGDYRTKSLITFNEVEISANYTVYDFEQLNPNLRSFVFRQFAFRDSSTVNFSERISLKINGYLKLSEQGDFSWSNFSSKPERYLRETFLDAMINRRYYNLNLGIGFRYFSLGTFRFRNLSEKTKIAEYLSYGPITEIYFRIRNKIDIGFRGWFEFISTESNEKKEGTNFRLNLTWNI